MNFNKTKQQLESFLNVSLNDRIQYRANGYRYQPDKSVQCYMVVDKKEIFNTKDTRTHIKWYQSEQDVLNDPDLYVNIRAEDLEKIRNSLGDGVPEERLRVIAKDWITKQYAKDIFKAQQNLYKSDFQKTAMIYLTTSIETSLESDDILLNVFALIDRRVGNKRLVAMEDYIASKHSVVKFFYDLRRAH